MKIHNKKLEQIAMNHSADINYKDFMKIYRKSTSKPCDFLLLVLHYQLIIL